MAKFLNLVTHGKLKEPKWVIYYGVEGVGKSTIGSKYPSPMFTGPERSSQFANVSRMPVPSSWEEYLEQLKDLLDPAYKQKTLVMDSLDHLEILLHDKMKKDDKVKVVEDCGGSFGKWVGIALRHWLDLVNIVRRLQFEKGMEIVSIAHYKIKVFNDPLTTLPYDRYQMKMNEQCAAFLRETVDCVFFCSFQSTSYSKDTKAKKGRGLSDGARVVYTEKRASHDAKNRYSLPHEMAFDYNTIMKYMESSSEDKTLTIQKDIEALMLDFSDKEKLSVINNFYLENKNDYATLVNIKNKLKILVGEVADDA